MGLHWMVRLLAAVQLSAVAPRTPILSDPLRGLDLWRGAQIGMSVAEMQVQFPAVLPSAHPVVLTGGETDRLQLGGVDIGGRPAVAHFYFKDDELVSVQLTMTTLATGFPAINMAVARNVAANLEQRYGKPYDCGDRSFSQIHAYSCKWLKKPLAVQLWYMDTAGQAPLFYVAFRQADDPGYNL